MNWPEAIQVAAELSKAVIEDFGRAKEQDATSTKMEMGACRRKEVRTTNCRRKVQRNKALTELRLQEDLLLTAPPGTPGIEAALKKIQEAKNVLKDAGRR